MNLIMALEMSAQSHPQRIAVRCGSTELSYEQLLSAARAAAVRIRASGVQYVALLDVNSPTAPIALFAAACAGVPYVPMNYRLTGCELEELLGRITPALLISTDAAFASLTLPAGITVVCRDDFLREALEGGSEVETLAAEGSDAAIQLFTSGTTGKPKSAVLRHQNLMSYLLGTVEFGAAAESEASLISVPPYHIAGISAVLSSTYAGRRMVQLPAFDAGGWLQACREEQVTNAFLVPTMLARIVDHLAQTGETPNTPSLRAIAYGGGKMPLPVIQQAVKLFPEVSFTNAYGLTETSSTICLLGPEDHSNALHDQDPAVRRRLGSVGRPVPGVEIQIRGDSGEVLASGQSGEVFVRGDQVAGEYLEKGSVLDAEGWFATRDRGQLDELGYLFLEGRSDDVIVRGGENISPGEIEDVLLTHPAVADVAVVAVPDRQWGETVGAVVVLRESAKVEPPELQSWVRERLRSSRVPAVVRFDTQLPYNETGKVLRRVLKQQFAAGETSAD